MKNKVDVKVLTNLTMAHRIKRTKSYGSLIAKGLAHRLYNPIVLKRTFFSSTNPHELAVSSESVFGQFFYQGVYDDQVLATVFSHLIHDAEFKTAVTTGVSSDDTSMGQFLRQYATTLSTAMDRAGLSAEDLALIRAASSEDPDEMDSLIQVQTQLSKVANNLLYFIYRAYTELSTTDKLVRIIAAYNPFDIITMRQFVLQQIYSLGFAVDSAALVSMIETVSAYANPIRHYHSMNKLTQIKSAVVLTTPVEMLSALDFLSANTAVPQLFNRLDSDAIGFQISADMSPNAAEADPEVASLLDTLGRSSMFVHVPEITAEGDLLTLMLFCFTMIRLQETFDINQELFASTGLSFFDSFEELTLINSEVNLTAEQIARRTAIINGFIRSMSSQDLGFAANEFTNMIVDCLSSAARTRMLSYWYRIYKTTFSVILLESSSAGDDSILGETHPLVNVSTTYGRAAQDAMFQVIYPLSGALSLFESCHYAALGTLLTPISQGIRTVIASFQALPDQKLPRKRDRECLEMMVSYLDSFMRDHQIQATIDSGLVSAMTVNNSTIAVETVFRDAVASWQPGYKAESLDWWLRVINSPEKLFFLQWGYILQKEALVNVDALSFHSLLYRSSQTSRVLQARVVSGGSIPQKSVDLMDLIFSASNNLDDSHDELAPLHLANLSRNITLNTLLSSRLALQSDFLSYNAIFGIGNEQVITGLARLHRIDYLQLATVQGLMIRGLATGVDVTMSDNPSLEPISNVFAQREFWRRHLTIAPLSMIRPFLHLIKDPIIHTLQTDGPNIASNTPLASQLLDLLHISPMIDVSVLRTNPSLVRFFPNLLEPGIELLSQLIVRDTVYIEAPILGSLVGKIIVTASANVAIEQFVIDTFEVTADLLLLRGILGSIVTAEPTVLMSLSGDYTALRAAFARPYETEYGVTFIGVGDKQPKKVDDKPEERKKEDATPEEKFDSESEKAEDAK